MTIGNLARSIAESPTLRMNEEARLLRERGEPVIHLGIGEPKNKAPMTAILAGGAKLSTGDIKYAPTDGLPSLKKAIIRYTEKITTPRSRRKTLSFRPARNNRSTMFSTVCSTRKKK